ncbi:hypothetical protein V8F20_006540 [Naviculisporaceae sp. PSN 640]
MPISRLPEATARELGSTLAVSTPVAVFKELLENALDAGASFVDMIISLDTLSRIEVRDNGHGICTEDLDALGRSGYTSKIKTFEDVIALGGRSLGFRGVALASINTVAEITLTTKTAADLVATTFQLLPAGGISKKQHVSAPVGTTVYVTKLFSRTPVREKVALRESKKNIIAMKELLQAYALARPHVKLQLRVVNGDHTLPWSYSPKPNGDIKDAVVQLFGTELASSCILCMDQPREPSSTAEDSNERQSSLTRRQDSLAFEAYLPHSFADATRINKRAFFSVDSRPVLTKRGTLKKLYDTFKMHLSRSMSDSGQINMPTAPFIRLNIRCESRSYDINIEPSKDDLLFHDEGYVIKRFEDFMLSVYPKTALGAYPTPPGVSQNPIGRRGLSEIGLTIRQAESERSPSIRPTVIDRSPAHSIRTATVRCDSGNPTDRHMLAPNGSLEHTGDERAQPQGPPVQLHSGLASENVLPTPSTNTGGVQSRPNIQSRPFTLDMSACFIDSDDEGELPRKSAPHPRLANEVEEPLANPLEGLNPWSIAKLTASRRRPNQPRPQPITEERNTGDTRECARRPPPTAKGPYQPRQYNNSNFTGPPRKAPLKASGPAFKVPGGAYKKPTMNEARPRGRPEPMVQTTLSRYRTPGHPGYGTARPEEGPKDPSVQPICSQNASSSTLPRDDPRSYLFNDEQLTVNNPQRRLRRCKTDLLPLEKTPLGSETHILRLTLNIKTQDLADLIEVISDLDRYYTDGKVDRGLCDNINPDEIQRLIARAKAMLGE